MKKIYLSKRQQLFCILGVIFLSMFFLNMYTPLISDDYSYFFGLHGRISNFGDVILKQIEHYFSWGGRSVAHTIAQTFLMFPKVIFNFANSLVYTFLVLLIYKLAIPKKYEEHYFLLLLIHFLLWFLTPVFGQNCLWLIGSCNYLWTTFIMLLFLCVYKFSSSSNHSILKVIGLFLFGVIAGWTNENTAVGLIVIITGLLFLEKYKTKGKIAKWKLSGLCGSMIGFLLLILAPGNFKRADRFAEEGALIVRWVKRFLMITEQGIDCLLPLIIGLVVLITILFYYKKKIKGEVFVYLLGAFLSIYAMVLSPGFADRIWFGVIVFAVIAFVSLSFEVLKLHRVMLFVFADFTIIVAFAFIPQYIMTFDDVRELHAVWKMREEYIKEEKKKGNYNIELEPFHNDSNTKVPHFGAADIQKDAKQWPNNDIASYFELKSIKAKE